MAFGSLHMCFSFKNPIFLLPQRVKREKSLLIIIKFVIVNSVFYYKRFSFFYCSVLRVLRAPCSVWSVLRVVRAPYFTNSQS
jgi:hypothetical protein